MSFVHLHTHSHFSLLDGLCETGKLAARAARLGMPAVALTDHGNLFGAVAFHDHARAHGVKPIVGCEVYVAPGNHKNRGSDAKHPNHLVLLCENEEGYRNLTKLVSAGYLDGFYYKPRVDHDLLANHSKGLIALSGCLQGEVSEALLAGNYELARASACRLRDIFGEQTFFLEVQDQGLEVQPSVNREIVRLSREIGIPLVATNDCHYLTQGDARAHEVMLCIQTGKTMSDPRRLRFGTDQFYFKTAEEMARAFGELPDALRQTLAIAERCHLEIQRVATPFPAFPVPEGHTPNAYFEKVVREGFERRLVKLECLAAKNRLRHPISEYRYRLNYEIEMIQRMQFASYFLTVWDFIQYARAQCIPVGPGRGSAAGSLVSYALQITEVDPVQHDLLFERFLNPGRISLPDIDTDFCMRRRSEVVNYVREKYGRENVAQIVTFGTMGAKAALKDAARALDMPYASGEKLAKLVPNKEDITLDDAPNQSPELSSELNKDERSRDLLRISRAIEGLARHTSTHAAGVVISSLPLVESVPLFRSIAGEVTTQYAMNDLERIGLLKMDFLGLAMLTVLDDTVRLIEGNCGVRIDLSALPLDDDAAYGLFSSGDTVGIFQFESDGMRQILRQYQPRRFEDLTALNALYRPGPIKGGMIEEFIARKNGQKKFNYQLPALEDILAETYGVIVYQEQVLQIANRLAGFSLAEADLLRAAIAKKKQEEMTVQREKFFAGCRMRGIPPDKAQSLFEYIDKFAGYGFAKAHACAYALIAYQSAYLKAHYPVEFMAALLNSKIRDTDKTVAYINEARDMGIPVLPPDVNSSDMEFTPVGIRIQIGLTSIKKMRETACREILRVRASRGRFSSLTDFCTAVSMLALNKAAIESIVKAGALDSLGLKRSVMSACLIELLDRRHMCKTPGAVSSMPDKVNAAILNLPEWSFADRLAGEKEALGLYVSGHPLDQYRDQLDQIKVNKSSCLKELADKTPITLAGLITEFVEARSKKGEPYAKAVLDDFFGSVSLLVFARPLQQFRAQLKSSTVLVVKGRVIGKPAIVQKSMSITVEVLKVGNDNSVFDWIGARKLPIQHKILLSTEKKKTYP
jgi:DNA polymerase-3 subunit alpha